MNNKFKKIITTALISMTATTAIGCATNNTKIAKQINNGVEDFVSSINNLDYVETNNTQSNLGKIVSAANVNNLYTKVASNANIENTITRPTERSDNFKLYILSESPFISLSSDDNNVSLSMQFSTEKIETTSDSINENINKLILKRAILMIYVNEIYNGNIALTDENRKAINAYVNIIKENASFLNGNRGMVKNQLGMASDLINEKAEDNIVNYYIIKSGEALEIRSNKIDSTISAIDSIISILEQNLTSSSCYYQNNLTTSYQNMISNMNNNSLKNEDEALAKTIAESIDLISLNDNTSTIQSKTSTTYPSTKNTTTYPNTRSTTNNLIQNKTNTDCIDCDKNSTTNQNNSKIRTLEHIENNDNANNNSIRKTQNNYNNTQNNTNSTQKTQNQVTPAETTNKTRRDRNILQRRNTFGNVTNQNQPTNPTLNQKQISPSNNQNSRINEQTENRNNYNKTTSINSDNNNRVSRVPYRVSPNVNN